MKKQSLLLGAALFLSSGLMAAASETPSADVHVVVTPSVHEVNHPAQNPSPAPVVHMEQPQMAASPTPAGPIIVPGVTPDTKYVADPQFSRWPHINLDEAKRLHKMHGVLFVDARAKVEWDQSHIPHAIPLPLGEFDKYYDQYKKKIKHAKIIVSYCHGAGCHLSDKVCDRLIQKGHTNVVGFFGGWPQWSQNGLPIEDKDGKMIANNVSNPSAAPVAATGTAK